MVVSVCTMGCGAILSLYLNSKWSWMPLVKLIVSGKTQPESGLHNMCEHGAGRGLSPTGSQRNSQVALRMSHICATSLLHHLLLSTLTQLPVLHGCSLVHHSTSNSGLRERTLWPLQGPTQSSIEFPSPPSTKLK